MLTIRSQSIVAQVCSSYEVIIKFKMAENETIFKTCTYDFFFLSSDDLSKVKMREHWSAYSQQPAPGVQRTPGSFKKICSGWYILILNDTAYYMQLLNFLICIIFISNKTSQKMAKTWPNLFMLIFFKRKTFLNSWLHKIILSFLKYNFEK